MIAISNAEMDCFSFIFFRPKKTVSFSTCVKVRTTIHINDYTHEEIKAAWYAKEETSMICQDISTTIQLMFNGIDINEKYYCKRGLECLTLEGAKSKREKRRAAWDAVLNEQIDQQHHGVCDDGKIASIYMASASIQSHIHASKMGLADEKACFTSYEVRRDSKRLISSDEPHQSRRMRFYMTKEKGRTEYN